MHNEFSVLVGKIYFSGSILFFDVENKPLKKGDRVNINVISFNIIGLLNYVVC